MERYDAIVAGLGAMGSAAAYHLARRGARVLGLDRFTPPHTRGASHGESRIIRQAYFEDPVYVPLVRRAFDLWRELEGEAGRRLLTLTGALMLGPAEGEVVRGTLRSAREHGLPHELLEAEEVRRRYPVLRPDPEMVGVYEERAGVLDPEGCVEAHLRAARSHGATLRSGETVTGWRASGSGVEVSTDRARHAADTLVLAVGPWLPDLLPRLPLVVERQTTLWFRPRDTPDAFLPGRFPVHLWETGPGTFYYGMPDLGAGVKVARHHGGERGTIHTLDGEVREADVRDVRGFLERYVPAAAGELLRGAVCRYTNTPTGHFLIDRHPDDTSVWVVSPCSGHGFKFASAIGESLAERVTGGTGGVDLSRFGMRALNEGSI